MFAWSRRLGWALMMKRTFGFARLGVSEMQREDARDRDDHRAPVVRQILEHLGVRASPLPRAPARDPALEQVDLGFDDAA